MRVEPTLNPTDTDKAYAAGFFDGEGSINIHNPTKNKHNTRHFLVVQISQVRTEPLRWIQLRWGGSISEYKPRSNKQRRCYYLRFSTRQALGFLTDILPWLIVKQEEAEVAISFQIRKRNTGRRTSEVDIQRNIEDRDSLHNLRRAV